MRSSDHHTTTEADAAQQVREDPIARELRRRLNDPRAVMRIAEYIAEDYGQGEHPPEFFRGGAASALGGIREWLGLAGPVDDVRALVEASEGLLDLTSPNAVGRTLAAERQRARTLLAEALAPFIESPGAERA